MPWWDPYVGHSLHGQRRRARGEKFSAHDRRRFLYALAVNVDVIYGEPDDGSLDPAQVAALIKPNSENVTQARREPPRMGHLQCQKQRQR